MKRKLYLILSILIIGLGLFLRLYKLENRAPFDWDQNRDYQVVSEIARGKPTFIGPVAKGEGGFFLGPLYYYLVTPAYLLSSGNPISLPVTSILMDALTLISILYFLRKIIGEYQALALASIWAFSWFAIEMSRISWNVVLVPLWSIIILWLLNQKNPLSLLKVGSLGLLIGLSWHIHAALIPISIIILILYWRTWAHDWKAIGSLILGYVMALTPLILFDFRHSGLNYHLLIQMFKQSSLVTPDYLKLLESIMLRLGKNTQSILLGISSYNLILGYLTVMAAAIYALCGKGIYRLSGIIIVLNVFAVFALKEIGFPEYYFAISYIPILILLIGTISLIAQKKSIVLFVFILILAFLNYPQYSVEETPFSLSRKIAVAKLMVSLDAPLDLRIVMAPGREGGIKPLYKLYGGHLDKTSKLKVVVTDQSEGPIIEGGELTTVVGNYGGIRVAKIVVQ